MDFNSNSEQNKAQPKNAKRHIPTQIFDMVFERIKGKGLKYQKIDKEKTHILKTFFNESPYPTKSRYEEIAQQVSLPMNKVVNWFKFQRKEYLKIGKIKAYKKRRILSKEEEAILEESFRESTNPTPQKFQELAKTLRCRKRQVRNWFAYRRKKMNKFTKISNNIISEMGSNSLNSRKNNFRNIFNDENIEKSSFLHSNNDSSSGDKISTETTSNQNTKKENSNNSLKNKKTDKNQENNTLYPQQILNKSQFYLPNQDQSQRMITNSTQSNEASKMKNSLDFNQKEMTINNSTNFTANSYLNNGYINCFPQNFQRSPSIMSQSPQISYIPIKLVPYRQYIQPNPQPTIINFPTLAYFPINQQQTPFYSNQMVNNNMMPSIYANFNAVNQGQTQNIENNLTIKTQENREG